MDNIHHCSNHPYYLKLNIIKLIKTNPANNLTKSNKRIMKIMMIKCILWKKIMRNTLMISMINKKILSWL